MNFLKKYTFLKLFVVILLIFVVVIQMTNRDYDAKVENEYREMAIYTKEYATKEFCEWVDSIDGRDIQSIDTYENMPLYYVDLNQIYLLDQEGQIVPYHQYVPNHLEKATLCIEQMDISLDDLDYTTKLALEEVFRENAQRTVIYDYLGRGITYLCIDGVVYFDNGEQHELKEGVASGFVNHRASFFEFGNIETEQIHCEIIQNLNQVLPRFNPNSSFVAFDFVNDGEKMYSYYVMDGMQYRYVLLDPIYPGTKVIQDIKRQHLTDCYVKATVGALILAFIMTHWVKKKDK